MNPKEVSKAEMYSSLSPRVRGVLVIGIVLLCVVLTVTGQNALLGMIVGAVTFGLHLCVQWRLLPKGWLQGPPPPMTE